MTDNYVTTQQGLRSPKTLTELCIDTLCRSLPYLNGELPPGLPQDVVDDIVSSLVKHNALNATTLRVLKNCELGTLSLAGCRGVTDEWLEPLSSGSPVSSSPTISAYYPAEATMESMDLDDYDCDKSSELFYNASFEGSQENNGNHVAAEESSCSTSSFVSASSTPYASAATGPTDHHQHQEHRHLLCDTHVAAGTIGTTTTKATSEPSTANMDCCPSPRSSFDATMVTNSTTANMTLLDLRGSQRLTDRGLLQLTDLSSLEVARLDNCHSIVGRGLLAFSNSHRLHTLSLANCRRMTDEATINISHLNSLNALSLDGCRCLTDHSLAALAGLYRLKKLDLSQCDLFTDSGLEDLEGLEELEELALGWCRLISDSGIDILTRQPGRSENLRILGLARCTITDDGIEYLQRLRQLEELNLNGCSNVGSSALGTTLARLEYLRTLDVSYCPGIL